MQGERVIRRSGGESRKGEGRQIVMYIEGIVEMTAERDWARQMQVPL